MPSLLDLTGQRFGFLIVVSRAPNKGTNTYWNCKCDCGTDTAVAMKSLTTGQSKSCGCLSNQMRVDNNPNTTHRQSKSPDYKSWMMMKSRCLNPNYSHYNYYGGRGITIHPDWINSFENFSKDMGPRPDGYTLDRKESNGNYEPSNCRWSTREEQVDNRRNSVRYMYQGNNMSLKEIAQLNGTTREKLYIRMYKGATLEEAIDYCKNSVTEYKAGGALNWD